MATCIYIYIYMLKQLILLTYFTLKCWTRNEGFTDKNQWFMILFYLFIYYYMIDYVYIKNNWEKKMINESYSLMKSQHVLIRFLFINSKQISQ